MPAAESSKDQISKTDRYLVHLSARLTRLMPCRPEENTGAQKTSLLCDLAKVDLARHLDNRHFRFLSPCGAGYVLCGSVLQDAGGNPYFPTIFSLLSISIDDITHWTLWCGVFYEIYPTRVRHLLPSSTTKASKREIFFIHLLPFLSSEMIRLFDRGYENAGNRNERRQQILSGEQHSPPRTVGRCSGVPTG